jgi:hypothetical protein
MNPASPDPTALPPPRRTLDADLAPSIRQALLALQQSRSALRNEMLPPPPPPGARARAGGENWQRWWRRLRRWPAGRLAREALHHWWQVQPWRPLGDTLAGEARQHLVPLVRRHPWASVGLAVAAGAGVAALRPWRWDWVDVRMRQAPAIASRWLWRQLTSAPVQAALAGLMVLASQRAAATTADGATTAATPPQAGSADNDPQTEQPHAA